jgi:ribonuclease Z
VSFKLTILGCNSALPTSERNPTAQVLEVRERFFLIDCGEGTQAQIRKNRLRLGKINHIFISHLHGDHFFGLFGLLSTYSMLNREAPLTIYSPPGLQALIMPVFRHLNDTLSYELIFKEISTQQPLLIYEDQSIEVTAIPMQHRIECYGYFFREKQQLFNLKRNAVQDYQLSIKEIHQAREGFDIVREDGDTIPNSNLVQGRKLSRSYVYYADTAYSDRFVDVIRGADLLYHEATFMQDKANLALNTGHSTSMQAANLAAKAEVRRLIVGHFSSRYRELDALLAEARSVFPESYLAEDGIVFEVEQRMG